MQSLAEVVNDVRSGRRPQWPCHPVATVPFNEAAFPSVSHRLLETTGFGSNPGRLRMLKFVPKKLSLNAPLVVVLHGCGQTASDIDIGGGWSKLAAKKGFALLFPEQRRANNSQNGFNWFLSADNSRGFGEALSIYQMVRRMIDDHSLDGPKVYVAGLSAGGAMTSALLAAYPDVFAGGAVVAGLPVGVASNVWRALAAMKGDVTKSSSYLGYEVRAASRHEGPWPTLSIWHGSADRVVAPSNADAITRQWCHVHGVPEDAAIESRVGGQIRRRWLNASGVPVIESILVPGMGHAMPVDPRRGRGETGPFFEDVGIASSHQIAKFWGIGAAKKDIDPKVVPLVSGSATRHPRNL